MKPEIIQQWQLMGLPHEKLLKDEVLENARKIGITSLQSYVRWLEVEKKEGEFNFSNYDILVEKIKAHNLKWVPFLILGPNYSTPKWFLESKESVFFKCLEHQKETGNQSIWNPNLPRYIERFLSKISEHYQDKNIFESIILGIAGNWGEAIYPTSGYWFGDYHSHNGFWAGDEYAKNNFADSVLQKYRNIKSLNAAWGTDFKDIQEITFPIIKESKKRLLINWAVSLVSKSPEFFKSFLKFILLKLTKNSFLLVSEPNTRPQNVQKTEGRQRWLDFICWYTDSMTNWADFWIKTARKYFPETKIYLVTGGLNNPIVGADFSKQTKTAQKYNAGIRVTNQTNNYAQSCVQTRLVSSAARFYKTYFTTEEEAVLQTPEGVTMRIFDAIASGAAGFYCRGIISQGKTPFIGEEETPVGEATLGAKNLEKYIGLFDSEKPEINLAVLFPSTSIAFDSSLIASLYNKCAQLRDILDFDLIDENMIKDGVLKNYQYLLVLEGELPNIDISSNIRVIRDPKEVPEEIDGEQDGVYVTRFPDKILYYNSNNKKIKKNIKLLKRSIEIEPKAILEIKL